MRIDELKQNIYVRCNTPVEASILFEALDEFGYVEDDNHCKLNAEESFAIYDEGFGIYCHVWDSPDIDPGVTFIPVMGKAPDNTVDFSDIEFGDEESINGEEPFGLESLFS